MRDFGYACRERERASRGAGQLTMNFGRGNNLQPAKIFLARLSTPHLAKPMLCDVLSFPLIFRFFCFDKVNNFFLSHGKSPTKILINFPKMFCAIFLQTSCTLLKYSRTLTRFCRDVDFTAFFQRWFFGAIFNATFFTQFFQSI